MKNILRRRKILGLYNLRLPSSQSYTNSSAATMKIAVLLFLVYTVVNGAKKSTKQPPALDENYLIKIQQQYFNELKCLKRIDGILTSKWNKELEKISLSDLGDVEPVLIFKEPSKSMYNTIEQEWLMESGSTARQIDSCIRGIVTDIVPLMNQAEIACLNSMFAHHIEEEIVHEEIFEESLKAKAKEQLPFRRFISFTEFAELMYQSRTPDALGDLERVVYEHAESYLTTEQDRVDRTYIMEQECEWKNARALRESPNVNARFDEFVRQILDSVNQQLANQLLKEWNLNSTLSHDKYTAWLQAHREMMDKINAEVQKLRNEKKDAQWLCEYATKLAYKFSDQQAKRLLGKDTSSVNLGVSDVVKRTRGIEKELEKTKDFRHSLIKSLADKYESGGMCFSAFLHLVQNHRKFDIALAFVDGHYNYPEFYCKGKNHRLGLIATRFCKCVGSFCVVHALAALFAEEYALVQGPDGKYKVVLSGLKSREKVVDWDNTE